MNGQKEKKETAREKLELLYTMQAQLSNITETVGELIEIVKKDIAPKQQLNPYERTIILYLESQYGPRSIRQISTACNMSWGTTKKYLQRLVKRGNVKENYKKFIINKKGK